MIDELEEVGMKLSLKVFCFFACAIGACLAVPAQQDGVQSTTASHNLTAIREKFEGYNRDFQQIATTLNTQDSGSTAALFFRDEALVISYNVFAINELLRMYDLLATDADRARVRPMLKDDLDLYARVIDNESDRVTQFGALVKNVEVVQLALKMKDDIRNANLRLHSISDSLQ